MKRFFCLLTAMIAMAVQSQTIDETIQEILANDPLTARTHVGVLVIDAETGEVLSEHQPNHLFTPASNIKLYTSACALERWGADHTFKTWVAINGEIEDGTLEGDLILSGDGDPVLTSVHLAALAERVADDMNIESIEGDLIIDDSRVDPRRKGPGWMWDDDPDAYNMSLASLMLDYNVLTCVVEGGVARLEPASDHPPIEYAEGAATAISRKPFEEVIRVTGTGDATKELTMHDPARWIGGVFAEMLSGAGVTLEGDVVVSTQVNEFPPVLVHDSVPMSEIIALFNKPSENAIGEMMLLTMGLEEGTRPATWRSGATAITNWLTTEAGLEAGDIRLVDGSGLSRYNLISPIGTVRLLQHMKAHPEFGTYFDSLTIAGQDGTGRGRMAGTAAQGNVHAKSGTMSGVSCWSGYLTTAGGRELIFSILTNGYIGSSAPSRALQDRLCVALCEVE